MSTLRVLEAARSVVDDIVQLCDTARPRLLSEHQLREAAISIALNIREGYGRRKGRERNQFLRVARGSAEECDECLAVNYRNGRLPARRYWPPHQRLVVIHKMLTSLMTE